jgi:hypothetical protein
MRSSSCQAVQVSRGRLKGVLGGHVRTLPVRPLNITNPNFFHHVPQRHQVHARHLYLSFASVDAGVGSEHATAHDPPVMEEAADMSTDEEHKAAALRQIVRRALLADEITPRMNGLRAEKAHALAPGLRSLHRVRPAGIPDHVRAGPQG